MAGKAGMWVRGQESRQAQIELVCDSPDRLRKVQPQGEDRKRVRLAAGGHHCSQLSLQPGSRSYLVLWLFASGSQEREAEDQRQEGGQNQ